MASPEGLKALSSAILDDARRRREEILRNAQERADSILQQAREAAEKRRRTVLAEAQRDAERYERQMTSVARLAAKSLLLAKREELISRVINMARDRLRASLKPEERKAALNKLTLEAATALGGGRLTVRANEQDSKFLTRDFLAEIESRLKEVGTMTELNAGPPVDIIGGVIVEKDQGRVVCDNSFEARLERQRWTLRNEIWRFLTGSGKGGEATLEDFLRTE